MSTEGRPAPVLLRHYHSLCPADREVAMTRPNSAVKSVTLQNSTRLPPPSYIVK